MIGNQFKANDNSFYNQQGEAVLPKIDMKNFKFSNLVNDLDGEFRFKYGDKDVKGFVKDGAIKLENNFAGDESYGQNFSKTFFKLVANADSKKIEEVLNNNIGVEDAFFTTKGGIKSFAEIAEEYQKQNLKREVNPNKAVENQEDKRIDDIVADLKKNNPEKFAELFKKWQKSTGLSEEQQSTQFDKKCRDILKSPENIISNFTNFDDKAIIEKLDQNIDKSIQGKQSQIDNNENKIENVEKSKPSFFKRLTSFVKNVFSRNDSVNQKEEIKQNYNQSQDIEQEKSDMSRASFESQISQASTVKNGEIDKSSSDSTELITSNDDSKPQENQQDQNQNRSSSFVDRVGKSNNSSNYLSHVDKILARKGIENNGINRY